MIGSEATGCSKQETLSVDVLCSAMNGVPHVHPVVCMFRINSYFLCEKDAEIFMWLPCSLILICICSDVSMELLTQSSRFHLLAFDL